MAPVSVAVLLFNQKWTLNRVPEIGEDMDGGARDHSLNHVMFEMWNLTCQTDWIITQLIAATAC